MTQEEMLKWQFEICGIEKYHESGFTGKGVRVLCHENTEHGWKAMDILKHVAPDVEIIYAEVYQTISNGKLKQYDWKIDGIKYSFDEVMEKIKPDIISCSIKQRQKCPERDAIIQKYIDNGDLIMVTASGNEGIDGAFSMYPNGLTIGACQFYNNKKNIGIVGYSGRTEGEFDIDYVGFMYDWNGTSAATPFVAGQIALFLSRFGKMSQSKFQELIRPYCKDLGDKGKDWVYGEGLIVLPEKIDMEVKDMFKDIEKNRWSKEAIEWANNNGLIKGFPDGTFRPEDKLTREQICIILQRYHNQFNK